MDSEIRFDAISHLNWFGYLMYYYYSFIYYFLMSYDIILYIYGFTCLVDVR